MKTQKVNNNPIQATSTTQYKYLLSPKCGAKTRKHTPCLAPAVRGSQRCRMHGGKGSGAPKGNQNALKHGHMKRDAKEFRNAVRAEIQNSKAIINELTKQIAQK